MFRESVIFPLSILFVITIIPIIIGKILKCLKNRANRDIVQGEIIVDNTERNIII